MTTHRGLGANTAFVDAIQLAKALQSQDWQTALSKYEIDMFARGFTAARQSLQSTNMIHASGMKASLRNGILCCMKCILKGKELLHL